MKIKVFPAELEAGIANLIIENNSLSYCTLASKVEVKDNKLVLAAKAEPIDLELFYPTRSILASTNWNRNDDIFGKEYVWAARHTPVHTPTNIGHDHKQIVGHITSSWVIDAEGKIIDDATEPQYLPDLFHLCNGAVIYRYSREPEFVARAEKLIEEIEENKKYVSMECLFADFDYGLITPENKQYVIARNEKTAFLTKHLRAYGGKGCYNEYKIGRFLKNMVFSGKGYVDEPANPDSIIFDSDAGVKFSSASYQDDWFENTTSVSEPVTLSLSNKTENVMEKTIEELKAEITQLQKQLTDVNAKALQEEITELKSQLAAAQEEQKTLTAKTDELVKTNAGLVAEAEKVTAETKTKIEELTTANKELTTKVQEAEANKIRTERVAKFVEGGLAKEEAEAKVTKFANLDDEQFSEIVSVILKAQKPADTTETIVDEETLATADVNKGADLTVEDETKSETAGRALSIAKLLGYVQPENNGE